MAQRKRAGLITRRTLDRNQVLLKFLFSHCTCTRFLFLGGCKVVVKLSIAFW